MGFITLADIIFTGTSGFSPLSVFSLFIYITVDTPLTTLPNIVCLFYNHGQGTTVIKNWLPLVFGPRLAIATKYGF